MRERETKCMGEGVDEKAIMIHYDRETCDMRKVYIRRH